MVYEVFDMVGLWQYNLNKKIADKGENIVTLDSILTNISLKNRRFKLIHLIRFQMRHVVLK